MIRELFLPDNLFSQQIIGLEIGKYTICGTQIIQKGKLATIQKIASINIDNLSDKNYDELLLAALKQMFNQLQGDQIRITLSNNQVFFKEATVPFLDPQKIKMVLGYEIESSLPFSLHDAIFDFIVTKQDRIKNESTVLIAIAQKNLLSHIISLIQQSEKKAKIGAITIDLIGTLSMYNLLQIPDKDKYQLLLDLGKNSITITYLLHGQPLLVRNLSYGICSIVSKIMHENNKTYSDIIEMLFRFGLDEDSNHNFKSAFAKLGEDLALTINYFKSQLPANTNLNHILIIPSSLEIKNIAHYVTNKTNMMSNILDLNKANLQHIWNFAPQIAIHPSNLPAINAATITSKNNEFNLMPQNQLSNDLLRYQIVTTLVITGIMLGSIWGFGFIKSRILTKLLEQNQKETVSELKKVFRDIENNNLSIVLDEAETKVTREKKIWFSFSNQNRYSTLKYLQVLSNALDIDKLNLDIRKLIIKDNTISLQGSVARTEDIFPLDQALASVPIFRFTAPQTTNFTIQIEIKPSMGGNAV